MLSSGWMASYSESVGGGAACINYNYSFVFSLNDVCPDNEGTSIFRDFLFSPFFAVFSPQMRARREAHSSYKLY